MQYGDWYFVRELPYRYYGARLALVRCVCGNEAEIRITRLRSGRSKRCDDCARKRASSRMSQLNHRHGDGCRSPEYFAWSAMHQRCRDATNDCYGGRGIRVCDRWTGPNGFSNFVADMGRRPSPRHSLDRIDNDGDYSPGNCRWATSKEQQRNKRDSINLTVDGETLGLKQWAERVSTSERTLYSRYYRGWPHEEVVFGRKKL